MKPPAELHQNKVIALMHLLCHHLRKLVASVSGQSSHQQRLNALSKRHAEKEKPQSEDLKVRQALKPKLSMHGLKTGHHQGELNASAILFDKRDKREADKYWTKRDG